MRGVELARGLAPCENPKDAKLSDIFGRQRTEEAPREDDEAGARTAGRRRWPAHLGTDV